MRRRCGSCVLVSLVLACGGDETSVETSNASTASASAPTSSPTDASASDDPSASDDDASTTDPTAATDDDASTSVDPTDASVDSSTDPDATDDATTDDTDSGDPPEGGGVIDVTLSGCDVDLGGTVVVSYNGSLGVASVYDQGATLSGSFQFDELSVGSFEITSQNRVDTGLVINLTNASNTWTNLDSDALVSGNDTISGTLTVETWSPARGVSVLHLDAVTLRNVVDGGLCTVNGTIETTQLYP